MSVRAPGGWPRLTTAVLAAASVLALCLAGASLARPMFEDHAVMVYLGYLVDRRALVPYRDFFDMNTPGAYVANVAVGRLANYTEVGARVVDLGWLVVLLIVTVSLLRPFGRRVTWAAVAFTAVIYLSEGAPLTLQREVLLLPLLGAALVLTARADSRPGARACAAGVLVGMAATIKPQAGLFVVPLVALPWPGLGRGRVFAAVASGAVLAPAAATLYLWQHDALAPFLDIATHYWPIYNAFTGERPHEVLSPAAGLTYRVWGAITLGTHPGLPLAGSALLGAVAARRALGPEASAHRTLHLLLGALAAAWLAAIPAGKFWTQHWWPFSYVAVLLGSLACVDGRSVPTWLRPTALVLLSLGVSWSDITRPGWTPRFPFAHVERIAAYLDRHMAPEDTVVPLDWIEGAQHAMLRAGARPGTSFVYDFHFDHHVSSPYIQALRARFLRELDERRPRYLIRIYRPDRFAGPDTSASFPALEARMQSAYRPVLADADFEVWERRAILVAPGRTTRMPPVSEVSAVAP